MGLIEAQGVSEAARADKHGRHATGSIGKKFIKAGPDPASHSAGAAGGKSHINAYLGALSRREGVASSNKAMICGELHLWPRKPWATK